MKLSSNPIPILKHFEFNGSLFEVKTHKVGHIHDTHIAAFGNEEGETQRYILQRINQNVFKNPVELMENIEKVTAHLRGKIASAGGDPARETLTLVPTTEGKTFYTTPAGDHWRVYVFIEGAKTYQTIKSLDHVYHTAKAFGRFQSLLRDFPAEQLHETIPNFHNTPKRFEAFIEAVEKDTQNRARFAKEEIEFVKARSEDAPVLVDLIEQGKLPLRVTHNDTKFNNVLIDNETGEGVCVIDLDTVMPGLSLYDFGDSIRSGANPAPEDTRDPSQARIDLERFEAFVRGYLDAARGFLTPLEIDLLPFSAKLMTLECGIRFLTDYLQGDVYFKTSRENHNLDRTCAQFNMAADMEEKFTQLGEIVEKYR